MVHLTLKSAHMAGNLIKHFLKSQIPGGLPGGGGGGGMIAFGIDPDIKPRMMLQSYYEREQ